MSYVFVSYSRKDKGAINRLVDTLKAAGYLIWLDHDTESIPGGSLWREKIVVAIENADIFLIVLSPQSVASDEVRKELDIALETKRQIVPVVLQTTSIPASMRYQLVGLQLIDLTTEWNDGVTRVLYALKNPAAKTSVSTGLVSKALYDKLQSILEDPQLSIRDKVKRYMSVFEAEGEKRRKEEFKSWEELNDRQHKVDTELKGTRERISELLKELYKLRKKQALPKHAEQLLERELKELEQKRDVLMRESRDLGKENMKLVDESMREMTEFSDRMKALAQKTTQDANQLIERCLTRKSNGVRRSLDIRFKSLPTVTLSLRGIIWFNHRQSSGSCAVIALLAGYVQKARSVEKVTNRVKTVGFYFLLRLESKKPRPRPINKDRTG